MLKPSSHNTSNRKAMASTTRLNFATRIPLRSKGSLDENVVGSNNPPSHGKRIRINLHHKGIHCASHGAFPMIGQRRQDVEDFLNDVWNQFGFVTKTYYHKEFSYVFVTFKLHENAVFALAGLNDPIQVQAAVQIAVGASLDRAELAKQIFVPSKLGGDNTIAPAWAPLRVGAPAGTPF